MRAGVALPRGGDILGVNTKEHVANSVAGKDEWRTADHLAEPAEQPSTG